MIRSLSYTDVASTVEENTGMATTQQPNFPFQVDPDDHCESPIEAYNDIIPFLALLGTQLYSQYAYLNKLRIYDPYYCDGTVIRNFVTLGFTNVYNRKEDCYTMWEKLLTTKSVSNDSTDNALHQFDVLITNPPYSENHIERLIQFVTSDYFISNCKPWFLLLPQWVHKKEYYMNAISKGSTKHHGSKSIVQPFYILPKKRYIYTPPPNFRIPTKSDVHKKSSPFISMWYCWGGTSVLNEQLIQLFYQNNSNNNSTCDIARSKSAIRDLRRTYTSNKNK
jgi:hypothetical protein